MKELAVVSDGAVAVRDGKIVAVGDTRELESIVEVRDRDVIDATGKVVMPGFVDAHTHLVFAGSREQEFELRLQGAKWTEILKQGGGILNTVRATRNASIETLVRLGSAALDRMLSYGTTTVEAKSGYGLTLRDEIKILEAIAILDRQHAIDLVPTFVGAHAIPPEFRNKDDYVALVINEMIPKVAERGLAEFCDITCEDGVFCIEQSRRILEAAKQHGLRPKIHADEIVPLGGAELAAEVGAISAGHLIQASDRGIREMAKAGVIGTLLPGTAFCLMVSKYPDARTMIQHGLPIALGTDFNPGTSVTESMQMILTLSCLQMKMTPAETIVAATINAAHAINRAHEIGSLEVGKKADVIVLDVPNYKHIPYHFGVNLVEKVIKDGRVVVARNPNAGICYG
jgi:imidazolonepropionase